MAEIPNATLIYALISPNCTLEKIKSILERHPIQHKFDAIYYKENPLLTAIRRNLGTDIMKELINHGININQANLCFNSNEYTSAMHVALSSKINIENRTSVVRFLLENGANVNRIDYLWTQGIAVREFLRCHENWSYSYFLPILQLVLKHSDIYTKNGYLKLLFLSAFEYIVRRGQYNEQKKAVIKTGIEAVRLVIEQGAVPEFDTIKVFFRDLSGMQLQRLSKLRSSFIKQLCALPIEYIFLKDFKQGYYMKRYLKATNFKHEKILKFVVKLCSYRCKECKKMKGDILKDGRSLWQSIEDLCDIESQLSTDKFYEILLKFSREEYQYFRQAVCHFVKSTDLMNLYEYTWNLKQNVDSAYLFNPDCFHEISRYLSKEDVFNYLLAILPNKDQL